MAGAGALGRAGEGGRPCPIRPEKQRLAPRLDAALATSRRTPLAFEPVDRPQSRPQTLARVLHQPAQRDAPGATVGAPGLQRGHRRQLSAREGVGRRQPSHGDAPDSARQVEELRWVTLHELGEAAPHRALAPALRVQDRSGLVQVACVGVDEQETDGGEGQAVRAVEHPEGDQRAIRLDVFRGGS